MHGFNRWQRGRRRRLAAMAWLLAGLLAGPDAASAQSTQGGSAQGQPPGVLMFSQHKCPLGNVAQIGILADSLFGPVLDELVKEGKLTGWGVLEHAWGDEWNWNVWYSATTHRAFLDGWDEYIARLNRRHPGWYQRFAPLCSDHKDAMYAVRRRR
jgi:hypothetical protein